MEFKWKNPATPEALNATGKSSMPGALSIQFTEVGENFLKATMPVDENTTQPFGLLHGGASCVLSETMGSVASMLMVDISKQQIVGVEINANHLKSAKKGSLVTGICKPVKVGRNLMVWQTEIFNEDHQMVCISRLTTMVIEQRK